MRKCPATPTNSYLSAVLKLGDLAPISDNLSEVASF